MSLSHLPVEVRPRTVADPELPGGLRRFARRASTLWLLRLIPAYRRRIVVASQLDADGRLLLGRAQEAIDTVLASAVNRDGLLDRMDNALTLPREEWEIAQAAAAHSALRGEQERLRGSKLTPLEKEHFKPRREALRESVAAVHRRVAALEVYAERVAAVDAARRRHRDWHVAGTDPQVRQMIEEIERRGPEFEELHAGIVRHDLAADRIGELTEDAATVQSVLHPENESDRRDGSR